MARAVHGPIIEKARKLLSSGVVVAAICGATIRLANEGFFDGRSHTSNNLDAEVVVPGHGAPAAGSCSNTPSRWSPRRLRVRHAEARGWLPSSDRAT